MRQQSKARQDAITLGVLEAVEADDSCTQRKLASELGIAVGLVNIYLKRCVSKGLVKIKQVPARRYAYYLTPHGFAEKSRLSAEYLSWSLTLFRQARAGCAEALAEARRRQWTRVVLIGAGDLAEIARVCAVDCGVEIVAVVDAGRAGGRMGALPILERLAFVDRPFDGAIATDPGNLPATLEEASKELGAGRVLAVRLVRRPAHSKRVIAE